MEGANSIGNAVVNMVVSRPFDGTVAVATHANGVYTAHLPAVPEIAQVQNLNSFIEVNVFPNPSSDLFQFNFAERGKKLIRIYNANGALILEENLPSNSNTWTWFPDSEGVFFYEIQMNRKKQNGKLISIK